MSLYCERSGFGEPPSYEEYDGQPGAWAWSGPYKHRFSINGRRKRCASCGEFCKPLSEGSRFHRSRYPLNDIEESIHGDEVPLATWHRCEACTDLADAFTELGFGFEIDDDMKSLARHDYQDYLKAVDPCVPEISE